MKYEGSALEYFSINLHRGSLVIILQLIEHTNKSCDWKARKNLKIINGDNVAD